MDLLIDVFAFGGTGFSLCAFPNHRDIRSPGFQPPISEDEPLTSERRKSFKIRTCGETPRFTWF
jgi:hypothetical protein